MKSREGKMFSEASFFPALRKLYHMVIPHGPTPTHKTGLSRDNGLEWLRWSPSHSFSTSSSFIFIARPGLPAAEWKAMGIRDTGIAWGDKDLQSKPGTLR